MTVQALPFGNPSPLTRVVSQNSDWRRLMVIMGVPIDNMDMTETLDRIEKFVRIGRKSGKTHQVATVNTDFLVKAANDENLRELLQNADMCTADGMPLVWGSKLLGAPLKERVAGSDMVPLIAERAAKKGMSIYLMGGAPGVAVKAADMLVADNPTLKIAGVSCPFWKPGEQMDQAVLDDIKNSGADILLVALGNPKQEWWIQEYGKQVGVPVAIGVGASLDFIVGTSKRAPTWMQKTGLEWMSRLAQEPKRLGKRYASNFSYFPQIAKQWWRLSQVPETNTPLTSKARSIGDTTILNLEGTFDEFECAGVMDQAFRALGVRPNLTINLAAVDSMDCAAMGTLLEMARVTRETGGNFRIVGIKEELSPILTDAPVAEFLGICESCFIQGAQY